MHPSFHQAVEQARVTDLRRSAAITRIGVSETRRRRSSLYGALGAGVRGRRDLQPLRPLAA